jgi:hypothetical protein
MKAEIVHDGDGFVIYISGFTPTEQNLIQREVWGAGFRADSWDGRRLALTQIETIETKEPK